MKFCTYMLFRWVAALTYLDKLGVTRTGLRYLAVAIISFAAGALLFK
jgi:hypothetical protein